MSGRLDPLIASPAPNRSNAFAALRSASAEDPAALIGAILHSQNRLPPGGVASFTGRKAGSPAIWLSTGEKSVAQICAMPLSLRSRSLGGPSDTTSDLPAAL